MLVSLYSLQRDGNLLERVTVCEDFQFAAVVSALQRDDVREVANSAAVVFPKSGSSWPRNTVRSRSRCLPGSTGNTWNPVLWQDCALINGKL